MIFILRCLSVIMTPLYLVLAFIRLLRGKEDKSRILERFGCYRHCRALSEHQKEHLIWAHCASVGETISALTLLNHIHEHAPHVHFLVTTYTKTAAQTIQSRNLPYVTHLYIPYDHPLFVARFLSHWRPKAVFWFESEFWPEALTQIKTRKIPAFLLNMRMSKRSADRWQKKAPRFIRGLLDSFQYVQAQTEEYARYYQNISGRAAHRIGNLKTATPPLPCNEQDLVPLKAAWKDRPIILFASTHKGEENIALDIYQDLSQHHDDLLLIIVPRHPERGESIQKLAQEHFADAGIQQRTQQNEKTATSLSKAQIYIADTLGELGLFYTLCPIAVIGNSFVHDPGGGHNPLEAAHLNCCILYGPSMYNFENIHQDMMTQNAAIQTTDPQELTRQLDTLLTDQKALTEYAKRAKIYAGQGREILDLIYNDLAPQIPFLSKGGQS